MRRKIIDIEITCKYFSEKALAYFSRIQMFDCFLEPNWQNLAKNDLKRVI